MHSNRPTVHVIDQRDTTLYIQNLYHSTQRESYYKSEIDVEEEKV
jgi:hypothetical protein